MLQYAIFNSQLVFRQDARTSRGVYNTREVWYIVLTSPEYPGRIGIGECAPLPDLSCDAFPGYGQVLQTACRKLQQQGFIDTEVLRPYPSVLFGLETAFRHLTAGSFALWDTPFSRGEAGIPINGLIWMGDYEHMLSQVKEKMATGFRCIKLKIGAIRFEEELALIKHIRNHFSAGEIELRVDANGAFSPEEALDKLTRLYGLGIHSIEQPIRAGQWEEMARLTAKTPLPIALDEELIGINDPVEKERLLDTICPQYIILKPSLHGGLHGCNEWIREARKRNIGWWVTSALESNIGLNAIAQWSAKFDNPLPQGLGTGKLFTYNIKLPLAIKGDCLWYGKDSGEDLPDSPVHELYTFLSEWYNASPFTEVQTSGSTGTPKRLTVRKKQMEESARQTCSFLDLQPGDKALLCMPLRYIAGKMMVVRALVGELDLVVRKPSSHPLAHLKENIRFAAMTPMQVYNSLSVPEEAERLKQIELLIIGGGVIGKQLEEALKIMPNTVYSTYGMTETLSHIALRRLNGPDVSDYYTPFLSVKLSLSEEGTLVIDAPLLSDEVLVTNDIVHLLPDGRFRVLGRKDNVINSGGIKILVEQVEEKLNPVIPVAFAVTSIPHSRLGEAVVLLLEQGDYDMEELREQVILLLPKYHRPKYIKVVFSIPVTGNGKTDRSACKRLANE